MPVKYSEFVKSPNEEIEYTQEMLDELIKCKDDPVYFITHYVYIPTTDYGVVLFDKPRKFQLELWNTILENRFTIAKISRQSGKSLAVAALSLWFACFHSHKKIGIAANKELRAKSLLSTIKFMYERLPVWLKPGVKYYAEKSVHFENGVDLFISATSKDSFRGEPLSWLILDELAFVDPPWLADEFWTSNYATISASQTSKIIVISTPNGLHNLFHRLFTGAKKGTNGFKYLDYDWRCVPERDDEWKKKQLENMDEISFSQEFGCVGEKTLVNINNGKETIYFTMRELYEHFERQIKSFI